MTGIEQERATERATEALAYRVRQVVPASLLADPDAFAARFMADLVAEHWRCIPPPPNVLTARRAGDPPTEEFLAAKAAITRKEDHA